MTFGDQIETEGFLKVEEAILGFLDQNMKEQQIEGCKGSR